MALDPQILANIVLASSFLCLSALGFSLIYYCCRFFHFAHAIIYTLGAYLAFMFAKHYHIDARIAVVLGTLVCAALGVALNETVYRALAVRQSTPLVKLLASMGAYVAAQGSLSLLFGDDSKVVYDNHVIGSIELVGGVRLTTPQITAIAVSFAAVALTLAALRWTTFGAWVRCTADDSQLANDFGIPTRLVIAGVFAVGSGLAGLSGGLAALDTRITPTMGVPALMAAIVAVLLGGSLSFGGTIVAACFLSSIEQLAGWYFGVRVQEGLLFLVLLVLLSVRPDGISGLQRRSF